MLGENEYFYQERLPLSAVHCVDTRPSCKKLGNLSFSLKVTLEPLVPVNRIIDSEKGLNPF